MKVSAYIFALLATFFISPCYAQKQHGKASYYSKKSTGARTASGQRLHHDSLTCAHRYFPFGTLLKVTNLSNDKSVIVKVIDRGPFGRGRIIDLSWAAAKEIGMIAQGVTTVKVEQVERPIPMRPENPKLPLIDFEVAESDYGFSSNWKFSSSNKAKTEKKAHHQETHKESNANLAKENHKENVKTENHKEKGKTENKTEKGKTENQAINKGKEIHKNPNNKKETRTTSKNSNNL